MLKTAPKTQKATRPGCLIKIESLLRSMNEAEKKVAQFILGNPEKVLEMTISEVAAESGVSESTVFKLCRTIDYGGFRDFKMALARQGVVPIPKPFAPVKKTDDAKAIARKVLNITIETLEDTLNVLDFDELERAYLALKKAQKVLVISLSVSRTTAVFAADKLSFFGIDAQAVVDLHLQAMRAALLTPKDVLLAFSRSGDTRDVVEAVQIAKGRGAITIGITNNPRSYFAKTVDIKLIVALKDTRFRDDVLASRIEHLAIVDVLYTMLAARNRNRAQIHHRRILDASVSKQY